MSPRAFVARAILSMSLASCAHDVAARPTERVLEVSMEQAGACPGTEPCWWRTTVTGSRMIRLENYAQSRQERLTSDEFQAVLEIVDRPDFRAALRSKEPTCPEVVDSTISLTLETSRGRFVDKRAGGCIIDEQRFPTHPYRDLFRRLDASRRRHFPGVLPF